jgi:hypothetical protein
MVVGRDYLLKKTSGPSAPKHFLDTWIVPRAVNTAGIMEVALDRAAVRTGVRSSFLLMSCVGVTSAVLYGFWTRRRKVTGNRSLHVPTTDEAERLGYLP